MFLQRGGLRPIRSDVYLGQQASTNVQKPVTPVPLTSSLWGHEPHSLGSFLRLFNRPNIYLYLDVFTAIGCQVTWKTPRKRYGTFLSMLAKIRQAMFSSKAAQLMRACGCQCLAIASLCCPVCIQVIFEQWLDFNTRASAASDKQELKYLVSSNLCDHFTILHHHIGVTFANQLPWNYIIMHCTMHMRNDTLIWDVKYLVERQTLF